MALRDYKKLEMIVEGKGTYNKAFWEDILKGAKALYDARVTSTVNAIGAAVMATAAATTMLAESFTITDNELIANSSTATVDDATTTAGKEGTIRTAAETASRSYEAASTSTITPTTGDGTVASAHLTWDKIPADDHELRFHYLAHKKCSPSVLLNEEEMYLSDYKSNDSPKADLLFICAPLLLKEELTCEEDALLESPPSTIITTITVTNSVAEAMTGVRNLLDSEKDMDDILYKVQLEKARLVKEKLRHSDMYKALAILEKVIEDTQLWNEASDEQEMTFYRRFASYLDTLLIKTDLNMIDGETGCSSSKIAIETNKQLFHVEDSSATYARKIDLILRYNDRKNVDLCSNEWKRSKVTSELKLKQQSKICA
ncbi:hypothetical protein G6F57_000094 [Rhizopus arrhizus]|nr:hypothetical protein G6F24_012152 [Rhizopus arrhizus]KAG1419787.1 hypothetical protein G6F58_004443 [Rhizopus delemar]KAG0782163.1 hypothetical protein G6F22_009232 [Rhizopus arrhizus]KAG0797980.1 hypothetical protein G6F21_000071 [Rhizopus arrhizus]KAG0820332.1 hypothetical protein G6F20_000055 [Rhizopus arrhizus]